MSYSRPVILLLLLLAISACSRGNEQSVLPTLEATGAASGVVSPGDQPAGDGNTQADPSPSATPTAIPATPTPDRPLAATVNGQPIYLEAYEAELARYEQGLLEIGRALDEDGVNHRELVLLALIEQTLIAQEAEAQNIQITAEMIDTEIDALRSEAQGVTNFDAWLQANQMTEAEFRAALVNQLLTEQLARKVTADVPYVVEQVRARYMQLDDLALAQSLREQIRAGADFAALAQLHSLDRHTGVNGGDLDFFAAGGLLVPEVAAAAFALAPGETSDVITVTPAGGGAATYYLVQTIERDPERPLSEGARSALLEETFESWLADVRENAEIIRHIDTGA